MIGKILRLVAIGEVDAHEEETVAVGGLHDAAAEVIAARERSLLVKDHLDVIEPRRPLIDELRARERGARTAARRFCKAEIDRVVLRIVTVEHDIVQATLTAREDL